MLTASERASSRRRAPVDALARLHAARDRARAALTVPRLPSTRAWVTPRAARPLVDVALWSEHVGYADRREAHRLERLVRRYSGFATATAKRHYRHGEPVEDLVQVSHEALMLALQRFDPGRGTPFLAYATPTIVGSLRRHFRDSGWALRVPRSVHELTKPHQDAVEMLSQDLGRPPTRAEIADFLDVPLDRLEAVERARHARSTTSIDAPGPASGETPPSLATSDAGLAGVENLMALRRGIAHLGLEDVRLLNWYYVDEQTQAQIGRRLGVSQMQVSRLLARAVQRLRPFLSPAL